MSSERGIALIMVMLVTTFLSALGIGVMLAVFMDRLATGNMTGSVAMLYAADSAIEIAARELAQIDDWNVVLNGDQGSSFTDGIAVRSARSSGRRRGRPDADDQHAQLRTVLNLHHRTDERELQRAAVGRQ